MSRVVSVDWGHRPWGSYDPCTYQAHKLSWISLTKAKLVGLMAKKDF
jgi:hypothetical protein